MHAIKERGLFNMCSSVHKNASSHIVVFIFSTIFPVHRISQRTNVFSIFELFEYSEYWKLSYATILIINNDQETEIHYYRMSQ